MQTNYHRTGITNKSRNVITAQVKVTLPYKTRETVHGGFDELAGVFAISTLNEYGDRIIGGRRIC